MKVILLCCFVLLIGNGGYAQYSYIPLMPNEPTFTNAGQLKLGGTIGFNHYENQAAFSPLKHFTLLAGYFKGWGNQWSTEYGASTYIGLSPKKKSFFFSVGYTIGEGNINSEELTKKDWQGSSYESRKCYYQTQNIQAALYYKYDIGDPNQIIGILFKRVQIQYNYLYKDYIHRTTSNSNNYQNNALSSENITVIGHYIMLFGHIEPPEIPFYFNWQAGIKPTSGITELAEKNNTGNPLGGSFALNLAVGINLDFY